MPPTTPDDPFGDLTPDAFIRETSARTRRDHPAAITNLRLNQGEVGFRLFVDLQLHDCRQRLLTGDDFESSAVLSSAHETRHFYGEGDEYADDFGRRLRREAAAMHATWLFVAMLGPFRVRTHSDPATIALDDDTAVAQAVARGDMQVGLLWSASQREATISAYRGGVIYLDEHGLPSREVEGTLNPDTDIFATVLDH